MPKPCPVWLRWLVELDNPFTRTNRAAEIVRRLDLAPGMRVLDVGCGPGRLTIPLARQVGPRGEVIAVDVQRGMLQRLRQKIFDALKPGGILSVTEVMLDPHFQRRDRVVALAAAAGFREKAFFGNRFAFNAQFEKPEDL